MEDESVQVPFVEAHPDAAAYDAFQAGSIAYPGARYDALEMDPAVDVELVDAEGGDGYTEEDLAAIAEHLQPHDPRTAFLEADEVVHNPLERDAFRQGNGAVYVTGNYAVARNGDEASSALVFDATTVDGADIFTHRTTILHIPDTDENVATQFYQEYGLVDLPDDYDIGTVHIGLSPKTLHSRAAPEHMRVTSYEQETEETTILDGVEHVMETYPERFVEGFIQDLDRPAPSIGNPARQL